VLFNAMQMQALLHGHSYTAFPIGCAATVAALDMLTSTQYNPNICTPAGNSPTCPTPDVCTTRGSPCGRLVPMWHKDLVAQLSHHPAVAHVMCTGTVLAAQLATQGSKAQHPASSTQAAGQVNYAAVHCSSVEVARRLKGEHGIYARPLGDVIYLMVPPTASRDTCTWLLRSLLSVLDIMSSSSRPGSTPNGASAHTSSGDGVVV
jgi:dethiobiotin synthetase/adenosylmethionine--8-amino-7-oxononanoate aminotransferase